MSTTTISVEGMTCGHCEQNVEDAFLEVSGVTDAVADRDDGGARVDGDADVAELVQAVEDTGYSASA